MIPVSPFITLRAIDSHTGGEPTRLIIDGFPDLGSGSMAERKALFAQRYDDWRGATMSWWGRYCASPAHRKPQPG
ncbi:4-hydroxyproline epimerase [compost metagenome]